MHYYAQKMLSCNGMTINTNNMSE